MEKRLLSTAGLQATLGLALIVVLSACAPAPAFVSPSEYAAPDLGREARLYFYPGGGGYAHDVPQPTNASCSELGRASGPFEWEVAGDGSLEFAVAGSEYRFASQKEFFTATWSEGWLDACPANPAVYADKFNGPISDPESFFDGSVAAPVFFGDPSARPIASVNRTTVWWDGATAGELPQACGTAADAWPERTGFDASGWSDGTNAAVIEAAGGAVGEVVVDVREESLRLVVTCASGAVLVYEQSS